MSRRADHERGERDNENITLLKPEWFRAQEFLLPTLEKSILTRIQHAKGNQDAAVTKALANKDAGWVRHNDGLVTWQGRIYIPKDNKLREMIISNNHDSRIAGHPGRYKTQELVTRDFWWPRIAADIRSYIDGCEICQRTKAHRTRPAAPLHPNEVPARPWEFISADIIGPLPESLGYNAILNIVDMHSKQVISLPTQTELSSMGWAKLYRDHVFCQHGLSKKIVSDRGPQFVLHFIRDVYQLLGIEGNPSTAYHPQTDGQTERINQEIEQYLRIFVNHHQDDWAEWLPMAAFSYNNKVQTSLGHSPFFVNHG